MKPEVTVDCPKCETETAAEELITSGGFIGLLFTCPECLAEFNYELSYEDIVHYGALTVYK